MIDERMEEQAGLYVLGVLTPEETRAFEAVLQREAGLQQLVAALRTTRDAVAGLAPQVTPPPALKQKILAQIRRRKSRFPAGAGGTLRTLGHLAAVGTGGVSGHYLRHHRIAQKALRRKLATRRSNWRFSTRWRIRCVTKPRACSRPWRPCRRQTGWPVSASRC